MEPQNTQVNNDMTPEEAKASLGIATYLQEQMLAQMNPQMAQEGSNSLENAPQEDLSLDTEESPEEDMKAEFEAFKKETKKMIKDEIGGIKDMLKEVLKEESNEKD